MDNHGQTPLLGDLQMAAEQPLLRLAVDVARVIESRFADGPRTLELDILDYQLYAFATDDLVLPHPRATERDFVVKPLLDLLPGHVLADGTPVGQVPEAERVGRAWKLQD